MQSHRTLSLCALFLSFCACNGNTAVATAADPTSTGEDAGSLPSTDGATVAASATAPRPMHKLRPIPTRFQPYADGAIFPSLDSAVRDAQVLDFYNQWKKRYLNESCGGGQIYGDVAADGHLIGGGKELSSICVSELQGFAMLTTALMGDRDPDAKRLFDGLYAFFRAHPSEKSTDLMSFNQVEGCVDSSKGSSSATDGDLDIAQALLVANVRWGSTGAIDYANEASKVIAAIKKYEMDPVSKLTLLGDFVTAGSGRHGQATRPSDFMIDHFRTFHRATGDTFWLEAVDAHWNLVKRLQERFSPTAGLVSDFVIQTRTDPQPPPGNWLEGKNDPFYAWNSCRVPWRLGTDWLVSGDARARDALRRINTWIRARTGDDPRKVDGGYQLTGAGITPNIANETAFVAPLGVAAMVDAENQAWLDAIWARVVAAPLDGENYYGNSIKLLTMIVMSGGWVVPYR